MKYDFESVLNYGLEGAADTLTRGFSDYLVKIAATPAMLLQMARVDGVDLSLSPVVCCEGRAVGAALIARRGWTSRVAGMAIVPEARRAGAGRATMATLLEQAGTRGDRAMVLEVIEQNAPAVKLYEDIGFRRVRRLVGFSRPAHAPVGRDDGPGEVHAVDIRAVAEKIATCGRSDLPWQIAAETVAQLNPPLRGFARNGAWAVVGPAAGPQIGVRGIVAEGGAAPGAGAALLRALAAAEPDREWRIGALWPEEDAAVFADAGFVRTPLTQWQMAKSLDAE